MIRLLGSAALGLVLATLVVGEVGPVIAAAVGHEDHVCVCPIDSDGHCQCADCIRLDVHGDREERERRDAAGARWAPTCGPGSELPVLLTFDPWDLPDPVAEAPPPTRAPRALPAPSRAPLEPDLPGLDRPPTRG